MRNCKIIYFQIYDGYDNNAPVLGEICTGTSHDPVTSSGNVVFIEYHKFYWHNWWKISWSEVQPPGPEERRQITNITGAGISVTFEFNKINYNQSNNYIFCCSTFDLKAAEETSPLEKEMLQRSPVRIIH